MTSKLIRCMVSVFHTVALLMRYLIRSCQPVGSAEVTVCARVLSRDEPRDLCLKIMLDELVVQHTKVIRRYETLSWNEKLTLYV